MFLFRISVFLVSLLFVLRQQEGGFQVFVYILVIEGRGFLVLGLVIELDGGNGFSQNNLGNICYEFQCDLRCFFLEYDWFQELDQSLSGEVFQIQQVQEMFNNNFEFERLGFFYQFILYSSENNFNLFCGYLNCCCVCYNFLIFNNDILCWERIIFNYFFGEVSFFWQVFSFFEGVLLSGSQLLFFEWIEG